MTEGRILLWLAFQPLCHEVEKRPGEPLPLEGELPLRLEELFRELLERHHGALLAWRAGPPVELLLEAPRGLAPARLVLLLKLLSAKGLGRRLSTPLRWPPGYKVRSVGPAEEELLKARLRGEAPPLLLKAMEKQASRSEAIAKQAGLS